MVPAHCPFARVATYDKANRRDELMRRVLGVFGLVTLGLLLGFVARLVWPRPTGSAYVVPEPGRRPPVNS